MTPDHLSELRAEVERIKQAGHDPANMARKRLIEIVDELLVEADPVTAAVDELIAILHRENERTRAAEGRVEALKSGIATVRYRLGQQELDIIHPQSRAEVRRLLSGTAGMLNALLTPAETGEETQTP